MLLIFGSIAADVSLSAATQSFENSENWLGKFLEGSWRVLGAAMSHQPQHFYEFGPFRLDVAERLLLRDGAAVPLPPKAFDLLLVLIEHHGHLFEKEELLKVVWPDVSFAKTRFICVFNNFACLSPNQKFRDQNLILT